MGKKEVVEMMFQQEEEEDESQSQIQGQGVKCETHLETLPPLQSAAAAASLRDLSVGWTPLPCACVRAFPTWQIIV